VGVWVSDYTVSMVRQELSEGYFSLLNKLLLKMCYATLRERNK